MKKVALSLLALALVGAGAFAQEAPALKIGGYLDTGVYVQNGSDSGTASQVIGDDVATSGGSYDFKLSYGTAKAGVVYVTRIKDLSASTWALTARNAYAWFLVPNLEAVKVVVGNNTADGLAWNGLDDEGDTQSAGNGYGVVITPAEGFSVGGFAAFTTGGYSIQTPTYSVGATFTVPATATINGVFTTGLDKDNKLTSGAAAVTGKLLIDGPLSATAGVNLYGLNKNAAAAVAGKDYSTGKIDLTVGYKLTDAFSATVVSYYYTFGSDVKTAVGDAAAVSFKVNPSVAYVVDPITTVGIGATYATGPGIKGIDSTSGAILNKVNLFEVKPNATFTIDPSTTVLVYYKLDSYSGDDITTDKTVSTVSIETRFKF
jgi:hypothetical protein